jgi:hypothetical protein
MWIDGLEDVFIFELKKKIKEYIEKASTIITAGETRGPRNLWCLRQL